MLKSYANEPIALNRPKRLFLPHIGERLERLPSSHLHRYSFLGSGTSYVDIRGSDASGNRLDAKIHRPWILPRSIGAKCTDQLSPRSCVYVHSLCACAHLTLEREVSSNKLAPNSCVTNGHIALSLITTPSIVGVARNSVMCSYKANVHVLRSGCWLGRLSSSTAARRVGRKRRWRFLGHLLGFYAPVYERVRASGLVITW